MYLEICNRKSTGLDSLKRDNNSMNGIPKKYKKMNIKKITELINLHHPILMKSDSFHKFINMGTLADFPNKSILGLPGDKSRLGLIVKGQIRIYSQSEDGKQITICYLKEGDFVGLTGIFSEETLFYAESRGIIKIYLLPLSEFILLYQKEIRIAHWVAEQLNKLLFSSYEDIISQSFLKLNDRIVKLTNSREAYSKNLRLSHQQIADELGTSREVVTRNLKKIRKKNKNKL